MRKCIAISTKNTDILRTNCEYLAGLQIFALRKGNRNTEMIQRIPASRFIFHFG